jgi:hypothetical protein
LEVTRKRIPLVLALLFGGVFLGLVAGFGAWPREIGSPWDLLFLLFMILVTADVLHRRYKEKKAGG